MNFRIIKSAKISVKLTFIYAFMFSLILLLLNISVLYGIRYYLYNQANKEIDDVSIIMKNKIVSNNEHLDLLDKELGYNVSSKENIFIKVVQEDGKILNLSDKFNYNIKIKEPFNKVKKFKEHDEHLIYINLTGETKEYGVIYIQIVKDMDNEYDFMKILIIFMLISDFIGIIASI